MGVSKLLSSCAAVLALSASAAISQATVVYNSNGFESFTTTPAALEGQDPVNGPWLKSGPVAATAVIQTTTKIGTKAVQMNRPAGSFESDAYWGVQKLIADVGFSSNNLVVIDWDMNVPQSSGPQSNGPWFGVEAYDSNDNGALPALYVGAIGMDSKTGEVTYQQATSGVFLPVPSSTIAPLAFNQWHHFQLILDYGQDAYFAYVTPNGGSPTLVAAQQFVDNGYYPVDIDDFTDAPISGVDIQGTAAGAATAYFDNYVIQQVPEPTSLALLGIVGVGILARRRA
jgi:hypothetical protein